MTRNAFWGLCIGICMASTQSVAQKIENTNIQTDNQKNYTPSHINEITNGESLQAQDLNAYWVKSNEAYYGKDFTVDKELEAEWSRIPHFYTPIYVYKYATGYAAATNFAHAILSGKKDAVAKYLTFLKAGASDYPLSILKKSGVDFTTVKPLEITLQVFQAKQKELAQLLKK